MAAWRGEWVSTLGGRSGCVDKWAGQASRSGLEAVFVGEVGSRLLVPLPLASLLPFLSSWYDTQFCGFSGSLLLPHSTFDYVSLPSSLSSFIGKGDGKSRGGITQVKKHK